MPVAVPVAVPVAGLTKKFFNQKDFLINVWGYSPSIESEIVKLRDETVRQEGISIIHCKSTNMI